MSKSEVYSWRLSPELKAALEAAARAERTSVAELLQRLAEEWLSRLNAGPDDEERQRRLHAAAARCFGKLAGGDPDLARDASRRVRETLEKRHVASRPD
jgi:hypothetical protein